MEAMNKESYYTRYRLQGCFPMGLLYRSLVLILLLLGSANCLNTCNSNLIAVDTDNDFNIRFNHASDTTVNLTFFVPEIISLTYPDYFCIVYNNSNQLIDGGGKLKKIDAFFENLTIDTIYYFFIKACRIPDKCFAQSELSFVRTRWY